MKIIKHNYINGVFVETQGIEKQDLINPATEEKLGEVYLSTVEEAQIAIEAAAAAFPSFSRSSIEERQNILKRIYDAILERKDELNQATVDEYGSPITATNGRTLYAAQEFLGMKEELDSYEFVRNEGTTTILSEPVGVIGAITPWNANYTHIAGKLAPAIAAGCTIVIKPSELNAIETQIFLECLDKADIPKGVVNVINGRGDVIGDVITKSPRIAAVSFTGSTTIGKAIWHNSAETMKRMVLELGGKSPTVVLEDADFEDVIPKTLMIGYSNSGQACHAGTRLIVPETKLKDVEKLLVQSIAKMKVGNPMEEDAIIGPMINKKQFETVQNYIQSGIEEGAKLLVGGLGRPEEFDKGYFVKPTVFTNVRRDMKIVREEIFGPVISVLTYKTLEEAIEISNDTPYGLAAYVFSADQKIAVDVAKRIQSGRVLVNIPVSTDLKAPFGGMKQSGIGRVGGHYSIDGYLETKAILLS